MTCHVSCDRCAVRQEPPLQNPASAKPRPTGMRRHNWQFRSAPQLRTRHRQVARIRRSGAFRSPFRAVSFARWWHSLTGAGGLRWVSVNRWDRNWPSFPGSSPAGRCSMTTAAPSTALATMQPAFTDAERLSLSGFLTGYRGLTREAYALDLRQFTTWCRVRSLALFAVRRDDIESFARKLEARGRARATVTRRLSTI